ncbi:hypothetical protein RB653_002558 [Dictyostelium firmibasis]|uniref:Malonyl-CoA:ACP transacylase (MAT) domain-containing protein n=1 Tax=Dictyostelium firmibasis TaxID=79012 RepID=A0AAN7TYI5_9MYCE
MEKNYTLPYLVFLFSGQGSFIKKLPFQLFEKETIFKSSIIEIDEIFYEYYGYSMLKKYEKIEKEDWKSFLEQHFIHCISFMFQVSIYRLYKHYGLKPDLIVGLSLGEIASAHCSGLIDLKTACYISYKRACAMTKLENKTLKKIVNIKKPEQYYWDILLPNFPSIELNGSIEYGIIMVAGNDNDMEKLIDFLIKNDIPHSEKECLINFHTSQVDTIKNDLEQLSFQSYEPTIPILSCSTAKFYNKESQDFTPSFLFNIARSPVFLFKTTKAIYEKNNICSNEKRPISTIEISPQMYVLPSIKNNIKQLSKENNDNLDHQFFTTICQDHKSDFFQFNSSLIKTFGNQ